jgi:hypothetical protein
MRQPTPEYYEGTMLLVRDDDDEILAAFAHEHESQAEKFVSKRGGLITEEDGVFVRLQIPDRDPEPWHGPFDSMADAREFVTEELQLDPDDGTELDDLGEPLDPGDHDEFGDFY